MEYTCTNCHSAEFMRIETIVIDSKGTAIEAHGDHGIYKCANCGQRIAIDAQREIGVLQTSPQRTAGLPRVRSSVSADERGIRNLGGETRF